MIHIDGSKEENDIFGQPRIIDNGKEKKSL